VGIVLPSLPACLFNPVVTEIQLSAGMNMMEKGIEHIAAKAGHDT